MTCPLISQRQPRAAAASPGLMCAGLRGCHHCPLASVQAPFWGQPAAASCAPGPSFPHGALPSQPPSLRPLFITFTVFSASPPAPTLSCDLFLPLSSASCILFSPIRSHAFLPLLSCAMCHSLQSHSSLLTPWSLPVPPGTPFLFPLSSGLFFF